MTDLVEALDALPPGSGAIGLLSSDEFTPPTLDFDRAMVQPGAHVLLLSCAGHDSERQTLAQARTQLARLEATVDLYPHEPGAPASEAKAPRHDLLYIPGGDPRALLRCMRGSRVWEHILERWRAGVPIAGSSAGAMALSTECLVARAGDTVPTEWTEGLGPLERVGLAVHAATRPRGWLRRVTDISRLPVLALDDETGVILRAGRAPEVIGTGNVSIA